MQEPNIQLAMLSRMAQKPEVKFEKLFPKLYNVRLWVMAYEQIAPKPGNMTAGVDGSTVDGIGLKLITDTIADLKASRYKPKPVRRIYIEKANGKHRPIGIPSFTDKLLQTVVRLILEAIYEPTFSEASHGFRPNRSCHTALTQIKKMTGIRWWVEGDIAGFFDNLSHDTLRSILSKRITDQRFLHLITQFLRAGYVEDWRYHRTYSGTPQGGNLSPLLSNIYLNELDQSMKAKINEFNKGKRRQQRREYLQIRYRRKKAKREARQSEDWTAFKALTREMLETQASDPQDPGFRRMYYCRYADDFLVGIIGSKQDAKATKEWLGAYLQKELQLELSPEKTLVTHATESVRFLGYDIKRGDSKRRRRIRRSYGSCVQRTCMQKLMLLMPQDKCDAFARTYGQRQGWQGSARTHLAHLSELEILKTYNAETRGFLGYYALADNLTSMASSILWLTTTSFLKTLADKRKSTLKKVARSMKRGPNLYVIPFRKRDGIVREHALVASTKQIERKTVTYAEVDVKPNTWMYRGRTELGQRLLAQQCEWCGKTEGPIEVHHVRKLKDLKGKKAWERQMIARRRKTMVLCRRCHVELHAGRLSEATRLRGGRRAGRLETRTSGSERRAVRPGMTTC